MAQVEDPWWKLSPEEKKRMTQDAYAADLLRDLDMRDDDDDDVSYGVPASSKAMVYLYVPRWGETREEHGCAVCLETLEIGQRFRMMPCGHSFHQTCIFKWLRVNRVCPICQFALPSVEEQHLLDEEEEQAEDADEGSYEPMIID